MRVFLHFFIIFISLFTFTVADAIRPLPDTISLDQKKVDLGKKLFFDPILSKDNSIACVSCHDLQNGGDDGLQFSIGIGGQRGDINAPTVYNSSYNFRQFWDGRAKSLQEQALGPIENPLEMGSSLHKVLQRLKKDKYYLAEFNKLYKEGITTESLTDAISTFEQALITPNAPFDRYLKGDKDAISKKAEYGYRVFKSKGCIICHQGISIGGNLYNKFGIYEDINLTHLGRYNITHREEDKYVFKVPSLRNIALTAPYMHDGRAKTLEEAVKLMTKHQVGRHISDEETDALVSFLHSLTGIIPAIAK